MNIWILNHYAVPKKYYYLARSCDFANQLMKSGHTVTIFGASTVHNSEVNLINDKSEYIDLHEDGITYVLFRGRQYYMSNRNRVLNHIEVARRMVKYCPKMQTTYGVPDVIFASAGQTLTLWAGIKIAKKLGKKCVCEVTDLWPESFVAYGLISKKNPLLKFLYKGERWVYTKTDELIFSMEGGKDYIIEKGWDTDNGGPIDLKKVHYINNGVDLEQFDYNKEHYTFVDSDLDDPDTFKVIYAGSIRRVNGVGQLVDVAKVLKEKSAKKIKIIIFGDGDDREAIESKINELALDNIVVKGRIDKNFVPYILEKSDLCLLHWEPTPIVKFGMSMNKIFEYLASGKPIISNNKPGYDIVERNNCGISENISSAEEYADKILQIYNLPADTYNQCCKNARKAAEDYDFKKLTEKLIRVLGD